MTNTVTELRLRLTEVLFALAREVSVAEGARGVRLRDDIEVLCDALNTDPAAKTDEGISEILRNAEKILSEYQLAARTPTPTSLTRQSSQPR